MTHRFKVWFPLPDGGEERTTYVSLPESYLMDLDKRFPVLYMFDGQNVFYDSDASFGTSWRMADYIQNNHPEVIIVAVASNQHPDNGRLEEYSPYTFFSPNYGSVFGRGYDTMEWFVSDLKYRIDTNFRTLPDRDHTFVAGSSMGGLMSIYALLEYNHVFSRAAALSPSLWTSPRELHRMISHASIDPNTMIYINYGSEEFCNHANQRRAFREISAHLKRRGIFVSRHIIQGGSHCEACWGEQIPYFMKAILR